MSYYIPGLYRCSLLFLGYKLAQCVTVQNYQDLVKHEKMMSSRETVDVRCMRLLPAQYGTLFYSKHFFL